MTDQRTAATGKVARFLHLNFPLMHCPDCEGKAYEDIAPDCEDALLEEAHHIVCLVEKELAS